MGSLFIFWGMSIGGKGDSEKKVKKKKIINKKKAEEEKFEWNWMKNERKAMKKIETTKGRRMSKRKYLKKN